MRRRDARCVAGKAEAGEKFQVPNGSRDSGSRRGHAGQRADSRRTMWREARWPVTIGQSQQPAGAETPLINTRHALLLRYCSPARLTPCHTVQIPRQVTRTTNLSTSSTVINYLERFSVNNPLLTLFYDYLTSPVHTDTLVDQTVR